MLELSYRRILSIAVPLMFGTFVQSIVMLTDTAFVSTLGTISFNAVNNGGLIYFSLFMLSKGLADGSQILIARKYGEDNLKDIGSLVFHTQILQIFLSALLFMLFFFFGTFLIESIVKSEQTGIEMIAFLKYRSWGIFFAAMQVSLVAFFMGIGRTGIVLVSTLVMALGNIFLDYTLIFGNLGFPKLGMVGAPLASSIAEFLSFLVILFYILYNKKFVNFQIKIKLKINSLFFSDLAKIGVPLMFQGFIALSGWLVFFTLIEREMTAHDLEVSSLIRSIYFLAFIPIFGFGSTTRTYVSNLVGQNKMHLIPLVQKRIILLCVFFVVVLCHGSVLYPEKFIPLINDNPDILEDSSYVIALVSGSIVLFSVVIVYFNSVAAVGKSNITFIIEVASIIIYLIACYLFIVTWELEVTQIWWVEYIYFGSMGIFSYFYLQYYKRKFFKA